MQHPLACHAASQSLKPEAVRGNPKASALISRGSVLSFEPEALQDRAGLVHVIVQCVACCALLFAFCVSNPARSGSHSEQDSKPAWEPAVAPPAERQQQSNKSSSSCSNTQLNTRAGPDNLQSLMKWPELFMDSLPGVSMSTHYSGIGCAESAAAMLMHGLRSSTVVI